MFSRNSVRRVFTSTLILFCLLNAQTFTSSFLHQPVSPHRSDSTQRVKKSEAVKLLSSQTTSDQNSNARVSEAYGSLPLRFEANAGQTDTRVKFLSRGSGYSLFLTSTEAVLKLRNKKATSATDQQAVVRMKLAGASPTPQVEGVDALPGRSNYFIGNDPSKWRRGVASYTKVRYGNIYPGIDLIYYGNQREIEYDFVVAAGADPNAIKLSFEGMERLHVDARGDLVLQTDEGEVRQRKPVVYQEADGNRQEVACRYVLTSERDVSFELADYDRTRALVIDPILAYSTYLGGSDYDKAYGIALDVEGNAYLAGYTESSDFPTANPSQPMNASGEDVFIAKLNAEGSALIYSTYLGGSDVELAEGGITVDQDGNAYVVGFTTSTDFPLANPLQSTYTGPFVDAFITKLNADGSSLVYSTYFGGSNNEFPQGIRVDSGGNAYITGYTFSSDFPIENALQPTLGGFQDAFVTKLNPSGSALVYSTYIGGSDSDSGESLTLDAAGNVYLTGYTYSVDFPTVNPFQPTKQGSLFSNDAYMMKLDATGTAILYSTYLGGSGTDGGSAIVVDAGGNICVTGETSSSDFPTVNPLQQYSSDIEQYSDLFVAKFNPTGSTLLYSTYLGGSGDDYVEDLAVDSEGNVYFTGVTYSTEFPTLNPLQPTPIDTADFTGNAFVAGVNAIGSGLVFSTYLGGDGDDEGHGIALDASGNIYVVGGTASADFITTTGAFQRLLGNPYDYFKMDSFICKIINISAPEIRPLRK
jgi:beta-propeller repeat-containing protein